MSERDVHQGEMTPIADSLDDTLLAGTVPPGSEDFAPIAAFADVLRARRDAESTPTMSVDLRAAIDELSSPSAAPHVMAPATKGRRGSGWRARWVVSAAVATFGLSGLGVAGALPAPVQRVVSDTAGHLGIDLPTPDAAPAHDRGEGSRKGGTTSTTDATTPTSVAPANDLDGTTTTTGDGPGKSDQAPGQTGTPGKSDQAPGQTGTPGKSDQAPGQTGTPGKSDQAPGQTGTPGKSDQAPGQTGDTPPSTTPPAVSNDHAGGNHSDDATDDDGSGGNSGNGPVGVVLPPQAEHSAPVGPDAAQGGGSAHSDS